MQATVALKEILVRAFKAVAEKGTVYRAMELAQRDTYDWDEAFVAMTPDEQADWIIKLFHNLTQEEIDSLEADSLEALAALE